MRAVVRRRALSLEEWLQRFRLHGEVHAGRFPTAAAEESSDVQTRVVCSGFEWPAATATLALDLLPRLRAFSGADAVEVAKLHGSYSGAMVLLAKPSARGQDLPRTVLKWDTANAILEEAELTQRYGPRWGPRRRKPPRNAARRF